MSNLKIVRESFAKAIWQKSQTLQNNSLDKPEKNALLESISVDIRKYTDLIKPCIRKKAKILADEINIDLINCEWKKQIKIDPKRANFLFDHYYPVNRMSGVTIFPQF